MMVHIAAMEGKDKKKKVFVSDPKRYNVTFIKENALLLELNDHILHHKTMSKGWSKKTKRHLPTSIKRNDCNLAILFRVKICKDLNYHQHINSNVWIDKK